MTTFGISSARHYATAVMGSFQFSPLSTALVTYCIGGNLFIRLIAISYSLAALPERTYEEIRLVRKEELAYKVALFSLLLLGVNSKSPWAEATALLIGASLSVEGLKTGIDSVRFFGRNPAQGTLESLLNISIGVGSGVIGATFGLFKGSQLITEVVSTAHSNWLRGVALGSFALLISVAEAKIFKMLQNTRVLNASESYLTVIKVGRIIECFAALKFPLSAVCFGSSWGVLSRVRGSFDPRRDNLFFSYAIVAIFCAGSCYYLARFIYDFVKPGTRMRDILDKIDLVQTRDQNWILRRQLLAIAYCGGCFQLFPNRRDEDLIKACQSMPLEPLQIQEIFKLYSSLLSPRQIERLIKQFPAALTPHFLLSEKELWTLLNTKQIEAFLIPSELKNFEQNEKQKILADLTALAGFVKDQPEKLTEAEWQQVYLQLRPLYEPLELFKFEKLLEVLEKLPARVQAQERLQQLQGLIVPLKELQTQLENLEQKLLPLVGDLFTYAYESLVTLTERDVEELLQELQRSPSTPPFFKLQKLLEKKGVKWKGDLLQQGILQQGNNPDNSKDALKKRLKKFLSLTPQN
jgi:hypothetical protein